MVFKTTWRSPSNIALVKYWGKHGIQLPQNPSVSFTLSECYTQMTLTAEPGSGSNSLEVLYEGIPRPAFAAKIKNFFSLISSRFPWLSDSKITIDSFNTFPHGAGIASSASAMSALALCLSDIHKQISNIDNLPDLDFISEIARLGSGSACRSVFPVMAIWGEDNQIPASSDLFAIPWKEEVAPVFHNYCDTILIIHDGEKSVSSTAGHELMNELPFAQVRYSEARKNLHRIIDVMRRDDQLELFGQICEQEALQLHALMMSGHRPFILMAPNTLAAIQKIWDYRKSTNHPVCFTLDAGANVHVLYPHSHESVIKTWLEKELSGLCVDGKMIHDHTGGGPQKIDQLSS